MPYLDAALAFAITMLGVATVVTQIVNFLGWLLDHRAELFDKMMQAFLANELTKITAKTLQISDADAKQKSQQAIDAIKQAMADKGVRDHLSNADLVNFLKQTELGRNLIDKGNGAVEVFNEISRRYGAIEARFTTHYREKARVVASLVALILAFAFNIDSVNILETYLGNPSLTAAIVAKSDSVAASFREDLVKANEGKSVIEQFDARHAEIQKNLSDLNSGVFPFGWSNFPYGSNPPKSWNRVDVNFQKQPWRSHVLVWLGWIIGIGFTAALAGLGSPFWYDVVQNLIKVTRGNTTGNTEPSKDPTLPVGQAGAAAASANTTAAIVAGDRAAPTGDSGPPAGNP